MRMSCGLTDDVDDSPIVLLPHDRKHSLNHEKKAEHLVVQLAFQNLGCGCLYSTAQVSSGIVDQDVYAPERLVGSGNELLHRRFIGNVGGHAQDATLTRIVFAL